MRLAVTLLALLIASPALALPPPGTDLTSPEHAWWECQTQPGSSMICCSEADGHNLDDAHWRIVGRDASGKLYTEQQIEAMDEAQADTLKGAYQVLIDGTWFDVPSDRVINETARCGPEPNIAHRAEAKVWYAPERDEGGKIIGVTIYCFAVGQMY